VHAWAKAAISKQTAEAARLLAGWFVGFLEHERLAANMTTDFDADTVQRITGGADQWCRDLNRQHAAQEAFLAKAADEFWDRIERGSRPAQRDHQVFSRWKQEDAPFPVSSALDFWWPTPDLVGWPRLHIWAEINLEVDPADRGLKMRSGILLGSFGLGVRDSQRLIAAWFGRAQRAAEDTFGQRFYEWHYEASYGEVWAQSSFDIQNVDAMRAQLVDDLVNWVDQVPRRLRLLAERT
jgi:hypothetical protein